MSNGALAIFHYRAGCSVVSMLIDIEVLQISICSADFCDRFIVAFEIFRFNCGDKVGLRIPVFIKMRFE